MCESCRDGATGRDGHRALNPYFRSGIRPDGQPEYVMYRCGECGAMWRRRHHPAGAFEWARTRAGVEAASPGG